MQQTQVKKRRQPPAHFHPLLWSLRWDDIDIDEDKEDIIVNTINEGTLDQWRWLMNTYGRDIVREVLQNRLATEFHPESRHLAQALFSLHSFRNARTSSH